MPQEIPACPVETTLSLIGDKWKVLILRDLMPGTKRFGELKRSIGSVTQKVLTAQLRAMEESGLPQGIYVTDCIADSPAYNAGIQPGDIITWINGSKTNTMKDFQNQVESLKPGDKVNVAVQRNGKDSYKEIEYPVTIGAR